MRVPRPILASLLLAAGGLTFFAAPGHVAPTAALACITNCTTLTIGFNSANSTGTSTIYTDYSFGGSPNGQISCSVTGTTQSGTCSHKFQNTYPPSVITIHLQIQSPPGMSVCLQGTGLGCNNNSSTQTTSTYYDFSFSNDTGVLATAQPLFATRVQVTASGTGTGSVVSSPAGIACTTLGGTCVFNFVSGTSVTLTETPGTGSVFAGWSGGGSGGSCSGTAPTCTFVAAWTVQATFNKAVATPSPKPTGTPTPTKTPGPTGSAPTPSASGVPGPSQAPTASRSSNPSSSGDGAPGSSGPPGPETSSSPAVGASGPAFAGSQQPSAPPGSPAAEGGSDMTPLIVAILVGAVIIGGGLFFGLRGRRGVAS